MSQAIIADLSKKYLKKTPQLKTGYTVRVHQRIKEGDKERVQVFEGLIIKMNGGKGIGGTITVRKISEGVGVEKIFPIHSPNIVKIEVKKIAKVRRSKLYYMRELSGKSARLKEKQVNIVSNQEPLYTEAELSEKKAEPQIEKTTDSVQEKTSAEVAEKEVVEEKTEKTETEEKVEKKEETTETSAKKEKEEEKKA